MIIIPINRTISTHKNCFICLVKKNDLIVPKKIRIQCYIKKRIYIPKERTCCNKHLIYKRLYKKDMDKIRTSNKSEQCGRFFNATQCLNSELAGQKP